MERTAKLLRNGKLVLIPKVHRKDELAAALEELGPVKLAPRSQPRKADRRSR